MANSAKRVQKHRDKMKAAGLKPVTIWVRDTNSPKVREDIRKQCLALRNDPAEQQILRELEAAAADIPGWVWNDGSDEAR